ncbi:MAG: hypothetical protein R2699_19100 [Acidimicrobiales bacterium]
MTVPDLVSRTVPSPVGPITLAGADGTLTHLRMRTRPSPPDQERWHEDPEGLRRRGRAARRLLPR